MASRVDGIDARVLGNRCTLALAPVNAAMTALGTVCALVVATLVFALVCARRSAATRAASAQEYIVGSRSFGALLLWILMGGEIYTTFTFLGAAGWIYARGAPAYYILAYGSVAYILGYFFMPALWEFARARNLLTAADFFVARYGSKRLGTFVALLHFCAVLPWYTLQLTGLQILLTIAGYGRIDPKTAVALGFGLTALFVYTAGLRGTAWASVVKDALVLGSIVFVGIALPVHFFGSPANMLAHLIAAHPNSFTLGAATAPQGTLWFVSTVALTGVGFFMGSQSMSAIYAGKSAETLRRNAVFLPLYSLMLVPVFFAGYSAILLVPGLHGSAADRSYLLVVQRYCPPAVLGVVAAAGCLAALLPASAVLLSTASLLSKNVLSDLFGVARDDRARTLATRVLVLVIAVAAVAMWLFVHVSLVDFLLFTYNIVTQFAPGVILGLFWKRLSLLPVTCGIIVGEIVAALLTFHPLYVFGVNPGFVALSLNVAVCVAVCYARKDASDSRIPTTVAATS